MASSNSQYMHKSQKSPIQKIEEEKNGKVGVLRRMKEDRGGSWKRKWLEKEEGGEERCKDIEEGRGLRMRVEKQ